MGLENKLELCQAKKESGAPSFLYERSRRRIIRNVNFFWDYFLSRTNGLKANYPNAGGEISSLQTVIREYKM